jgi:hypothetical protein
LERSRGFREFTPALLAIALVCCSSGLRSENRSEPRVDAAAGDSNTAGAGGTISLDGSGFGRPDVDSTFPSCRFSQELPLSSSDAGDAGNVCDFAIPEPPPLAEYHFNKVNLQIELPSGLSEDLYYVRNASGCDPYPGWFYDVETSPTRVVLCPEPCARIYQIPGAKLIMNVVNCPL